MDGWMGDFCGDGFSHSRGLGRVGFGRGGGLEGGWQVGLVGMERGVDGVVSFLFLVFLKGGWASENLER